MKHTTKEVMNYLVVVVEWTHADVALDTFGEFVTTAFAKRHPDKVEDAVVLNDEDLLEYLLNTMTFTEDGEELPLEELYNRKNIMHLSLNNAPLAYYDLSNKDNMFGMNSKTIRFEDDIMFYITPMGWKWN